jgi:hypothetical protein
MLKWTSITYRRVHGSWSDYLDYNYILMCWSCVVPLYMVSFNPAYIHWDSEPVMDYMILCDAMQYVTWSRYCLVMTATTKIGLRFLTFCSSLSTLCCWWVLHNTSACAKLSYQQAFTLGTSQFMEAYHLVTYSYDFCQDKYCIALQWITIQYSFRVSKDINSIVIDCM